MLRGLDAGRVRCVVVGGVAAAAQGATYVTLDLDICYDPAEDNVTALAMLLASWHAYPRGGEQGLPFFMDTKTFRAAPVMTLATSEGAIDVFDRINGVGEFAAVVAASTRLEAFGLRFRVLTLPALIRAKRAAGRSKDVAQLPELEALVALRKARRGKKER
jgi:hypothetical protein